VEGWACWSSAEAAIRGGFVAAHVDASAALTLAAAQGVRPVVAADLITAVHHGMSIGLAKKKGDAA
jgi:hypothetical protein